jgi:NADH-quinone oxidoreductase subunit J
LLSVLAVSSPRLLRSAVYLFGVLTAVAGLYFLMGYYFLGAVQLTVYAGGIVVLIIFSILLTHEIDHKMEAPGALRAGGAGAVVLAATLLTLYLVGGYTFALSSAPDRGDLDTIGTLLLNPGEGGYLLPFELISVLLLAAIFGAIVIAKYNLGESQQEKHPL